MRGRDAECAEVALLGDAASSQIRRRSMDPDRSAEPHHAASDPTPRSAPSSQQLQGHSVPSSQPPPRLLRAVLAAASGSFCAILAAAKRSIRRPRSDGLSKSALKGQFACPVPVTKDKSAPGLFTVLPSAQRKSESVFWGHPASSLANDCTSDTCKDSQSFPVFVGSQSCMCRCKTTKMAFSASKTPVKPQRRSIVDHGNSYVSALFSQFAAGTAT